MPHCRKIAIPLVCTVLLVWPLFAKLNIPRLDHAPLLAASSSSELSDPQFAGRYIYPAAHALDGNMATCWAEAVRGPGVGEYLTIQFRKPVAFDEIQIVNGLGKNKQLYYANHRIRRLEIFELLGKLYQKRTVTLRDHMRGWQSIKFKKLQGASSVTFTIRAVYKGKTYQDTCISGIRFLRKNRVLPYRGLAPIKKFQEKMARAKTRQKLKKDYRRIFDRYYVRKQMVKEVYLENKEVGIRYIFTDYEVKGSGMYQMEVYDKKGNWNPGAGENGSYTISHNRIIFEPYKMYARSKRVMYLLPQGASGLYLNGVFYTRKLHSQ